MMRKTTMNGPGWLSALAAAGALAVAPVALAQDGAPPTPPAPSPERLPEGPVADCLTQLGQISATTRGQLTVSVTAAVEAIAAADAADATVEELRALGADARGDADVIAGSGITLVHETADACIEELATSTGPAAGVRAINQGRRAAAWSIRLAERFAKLRIAVAVGLALSDEELPEPPDDPGRPSGEPGDVGAAGAA